MIPLPLTSEDKNAGYFRELSMRQVEVRGPSSSTIPAGLGASSRRSWPTTSASAGLRGSEGLRRLQARREDANGPQTRVFCPGTEVKIDFGFKLSRVKQYLKEGRALRIETVINKPKDLATSPLEHLLRARRQGQTGQRPPAYDREGWPGLAIGDALFERIACRETLLHYERRRDILPGQQRQSHLVEVEIMPSWSVSWQAPQGHVLRLLAVTVLLGGLLSEGLTKSVSGASETASACGSSSAKQWAGMGNGSPPSGGFLGVEGAINHYNPRLCTGSYAIYPTSSDWIMEFNTNGKWF